MIRSFVVIETLQSCRFRPLLFARTLHGFTLRVYNQHDGAGRLVRAQIVKEKTFPRQSILYYETSIKTVAL